MLKRIFGPLLRPLARAALDNPMVRRLARHQVARLDAEAWAAFYADKFVRGGAGADYGVDAAARRRLTAQFQATVQALPSGTSWLVHVALAEAILRIPRRTPGDVVECGVWKGASAASLSQVCALTGRRLLVCDSFQGLPDEGGGRHIGLHTRVYGHYAAGQFAGSLDEVRANIAAHGVPGVCNYVPGFFADSLPGALTEPVAFAFLDVDLAGSTRDCLRAIWPRLVDGGEVYSDDAGDLAVVQVFFDDAWWRTEVGVAAPGFVGSGCGLPLRPGHSSLGYSRKVEKFSPAEWRRVPFLEYPEEDVSAGL